MAVVHIANRDFRRLLLCLNGISKPAADDPLPVPSTPSGPEWTLATVRRLGFVQVDPISAVERAQHHILFSRNPRYRQRDLEVLLERERKLFENWTHDAAILPVELFPGWRHYMDRFRRYEVHAGYRRYFAAVKPRHVERAVARIERDGPLRPRDLGGRRVRFADATFGGQSLAKLTLERAWRTGELAVSGRVGREKVYDLSRRVIPDEHFRRRVGRASYDDWACRESLLRLGAATPAEIARFYDAVSKETAADWCRRRSGRGVVEVRVESAEGEMGPTLYALERIVESIPRMPRASRRLRLLNPFDPLIHDRRRVRRIFGFDYKVEIWVPPAKRTYGYYVLPVLEGHRFTGRVDAKADRKRGVLDVLGLWWEPGVRRTKRRRAALERELERLAVFAGTSRVAFASGVR